MGYPCIYKHFKPLQVVEGCGNSVSKHLNAVYNSPPHYCWRASLKKVGLGCADLERTPFGAHDSSHSLDDGHPSLYIDGDVHDLDLIPASLHVTDRRHPQYVSATKV